jgi:hypothetical protein
MRWILFSMLLGVNCLAGEPPFSHIRRKPVISPYIKMDDQFSMPYQMEVLPHLTRSEREAEMRQNQNAKRDSRSIMPQVEGIRPTGHPTYFMIFDFRTF